MAVFCFLLFFTSSCSAKDVPPKNAQPKDNNKLQEQSEKDKIVEGFKNRYSAIELNNVCDDTSFSVEIADKCKGKSIYSQILYINDAFYSGEDLYMYAEFFDNTKFLLKITQEQYSKIQTLHNYNFEASLHIIFSLDNIEPMIPTLQADLYFDITRYDNILDDENVSLSFDSRIIKGNLVDIMEVQ